MSPIRYWILAADGRTAVEADRDTWSMWFQTANRIVFQTMVGKLQVSTVFLGLDHNWFHDGPPLIWETMVFGGDSDEETISRYSTYEQALAGHTMTVTDLMERYDGESR